MRRRGKHVPPGSRLEYVVTTMNGLNAAQYDKLEDVEYFAKYRGILKVEVLHYLKLSTNPIDELLNILGEKPGFVEYQWKFRSRQRYRMLREIEKICAPKIVYEN